MDRPRHQSAFFLFRAEEYDKLKARNPGKTPQELASLLGEKWRNLTDAEKQHFTAKAAAMNAANRMESTTMPPPPPSAPQPPLPSPRPPAVTVNAPEKPKPTPKPPPPGPSLPATSSAAPAKPGSGAALAAPAPTGKRPAANAAAANGKKLKVDDDEPSEPNDLPEPQTWAKKSVYAAKNVLEDILNCHNPMIARSKRQESEAKMDKLLVKFAATEREHIEVEPVYLGFVEDFKNLREYPMTSGSVNKEIEIMFKHMKAHVFSHHPLQDFFEPSKNGYGYVPKKVKCKSGALEKMYDVDHVVPRRWGGLDHPRNFVVMHRSMNRALRDAMPEDKIAYLERTNRTALRKVAEFYSGLLNSTLVQGAYKEYIEKEMPSW